VGFSKRQRGGEAREQFTLTILRAKGPSWPRRTFQTQPSAPPPTRASNTRSSGPKGQRRSLGTLKSAAVQLGGPAMGASSRNVRPNHCFI
jgi:hypothetical protein